MATKESTGSEQDVRDALFNGEPIPAGWTFDPHGDPQIRKSTDQDLRAAEEGIRFEPDGSVVASARVPSATATAAPAPDAKDAK